MLIARLQFNDVAVEKLARRGIDQREVEQLPRNGALATRNPHPRAAGSRMMIGETDGGRVLSVIIEPDAGDPAVWHVRTAWVASRRERGAYHRRWR